MSEPELIILYYPLGNLQDLEGVLDKQYVSAFRQVLIGLEYLHKHGIVYRDLKPGNLLVKEPFTVIIADFDLLKLIEDQPLQISCGTHLYTAPEVYPGLSNGYRPQADIQSIGVIFLLFVYDLPSKPKVEDIPAEVKIQIQSVRWSEKLVEKVNDFEDDNKLIAVLGYMIRIAPRERLTAKQCLEQGYEHGLFVKYYNSRIVDHDSVSTPTQQLSKITRVKASDNQLPSAICNQIYRANHPSKQSEEAETVDIQKVRIRGQFYSIMLTQHSIVAGTKLSLNIQFLEDGFICGVQITRFALLASQKHYIPRIIWRILCRA